MSRPHDLHLDVDLQHGMVPISKAASALAALIKRSRTYGQPIIVTQKGYPTGVLLPIELFTALREIAARASGEEAPADLQFTDLSASSPEPEAEPAPARPAAKRRSRSAKAAVEIAAETGTQESSADDEKPAPRSRRSRSTKNPA